MYCTDCTRTPFLLRRCSSADITYTGRTYRVCTTIIQVYECMIGVHVHLTPHFATAQHTLHAVRLLCGATMRLVQQAGAGALKHVFGSGQCDTGCFHSFSSAPQQSVAKLQLCDQFIVHPSRITKAGEILASCCFEWKEWRVKGNGNISYFISYGSTVK